MWYIWLIAAGVFILFEIMTTGFLIFWLAIASLISMIISIFIDSIFIQSVVFLISSCLLIMASKPFFNKIKNNTNSIDTNAYSLIGKKAIVTTEIDNSLNVGQVKIGGEYWSALSFSDDLKIQKDSKVEILKIEGVKVIVKEL